MLTKGKARGRARRTPRSSAATRGRRWRSGTRSTTRRRRPAASSPRRPRARSTPTSTRPCSRAEKGELAGPVKTQYGYYVFTVSNVIAASQQTLAEAKETIKQTLASENQQKALTAFTTEFTKRWREKTECAEGYKTSDCANGPKATPTPRMQ